MKRETKFRAWDKVDKRMIIDEQDFIPLKVTNKGVFRLNPPHKEAFWEIVSHDRFNITEYTGLSDRNGTDIFESDICKSLKGVFLIEYVNAGFSLKSLNKNCRNWAFTSHSAKSIEVIGNLYENTGLI